MGRCVFAHAPCPAGLFTWSEWVCVVHIAASVVQVCTMHIKKENKEVFAMKITIWNRNGRLIARKRLPACYPQTEMGAKSFVDRVYGNGVTFGHARIGGETS